MDDMYTEKLKDAFRQEAGEILVDLESSLMELEEYPLDAEIISKVFRGLHTIKGSGSMTGFDKIADFTHEIESVFDLVRKDELSVTSGLINLTLSAVDHIALMLKGDDENKDITKKLENLADSVRNKRESFTETVSMKASEDGEEAESAKELSIYRIRFKPSAEIFLRGTSPINLLDELKELGNCNITARFYDLPDLEDMNPEHCYIFWDIILSAECGINAIKDIFIFVEDESELKIELICEGAKSSFEGVSTKLGEILVERGAIDRETLKEILLRQESIAEMINNAGPVDNDEIESVLSGHVQNKKIAKNHIDFKKESSIRVGSDKLDKLINMVGELVTIQAGLSQKASDRKDSEFQSLAEEVERITSSLRDVSMSLRMIPIGTTFSRFKRLIHDLSQQLGKKIELITEGSETQMDATIIERLVDPMIHLIRNSIDHGIEKVEVREKIGKNPTGTIHLSAVHSGAYVLIRIRDDGAGLDTGQLLDKAVQNGIIPSGTIPTEKEIFELIFAPGFSTAKELTGVSGRGVGMDVVKKAIEELGGIIDLESKRGSGTLITLKIPLTLAIIRGLLVRIRRDYYIIPLSFVEECIELKVSEADRNRNTSQVNVRGNLIPCINLRKIFLFTDKAPDIQHAVIVNSEDEKTGFLVDEVIGEQQTVVKNLGFVYKDVEGVSGATIRGDGTVALILDTLKLIQSVKLSGEAV